ncbi:hypothetical protein E5206_09540 [Arthrobacter sp. PAMC25564]|uniref:hypothetical protein n=1 Tax=Arthrobacter sp. PAMC25564 TaxID=2565366 RepID=UPI0010A20381|nr:hypothetical protein [Arthrobacter sp. PAMC25564]QCB97145.1 hypothetical protein E5206_09540 [Arthrobacter sp. PAMC25564]
MSETKPDPNLPEFVTTDAIKAAIDAIEDGHAAWTPEWMQNALMSAWQAGNLAGDSSAYHGGLYKEYNPFMTQAERKAWY